MQFFGFEISRKKEKELGSVVPPSPQDGATVINTGVNAGGYYGMVMDLDGVVKNENDLIRRYREVAQYPDCDNAIEEIKFVTEKYNIKYVIFNDELFNFNKKYLDDFCSAYKKEIDLPFECDIRADLCKKETFVTLKKANCIDASFLFINCCLLI